VVKINIAGGNSTCTISIGNTRMRSLVDTGARVSLMNRTIYQSLANRPRLKSSNLCLQTVNGESMPVDGRVNIRFTIGSKSIQQAFYIVPNLNRNIILGQDWLVDNGVRLYYDLGGMKIGKQYVPLESDIHVSAALLAKQETVLRPQHSTICMAKIQVDPSRTSCRLFQVSAADTGFITSEPGLLVCNTVVELHQARTVPIMIVNQTNKTFRLRRGEVLATAESMLEQNLVDFKREVGQVKNSEMGQTKNSLNIDPKDISAPPEYQERVTKLIYNNSDVFAATDAELDHTDTVKMRIDTGDHPPIKLKPYRTPLNKRETVDKAVDDMLEAGIISRSRSPWSFPVVIVDKKDGSKRFCVDFRQLNAITKAISFPLPVIDDILALLGKSNWFTSLDLRGAYWQILMDDADKEKTAFACFKGLFEFNVLPFGLSGAPGVFSELMSIVLEGLEFAIAYLDDILIFSETLEEHMRHIQIVMDRLREHHLKLKLKKCSFLQSETSYLGFKIGKDGVKPNPEKVQVIRSLPVPRTVKDVRSFIGAASFYRRFIPNFSEIAEPMIKLTKKYARFVWSDECQTAFEYLKESLSVVPLLAYPDTRKSYVLYTDASDTCIGACLSQPCDELVDEPIPGVRNERPIYFLSHKLSPTQTKWSTIEKEAYAIHFALQKLDYYLHSAEFIIRTDHRPLKYLLESKMQNRKIQLWALGIAGYNCTIEYIPGTENTCADLLSRLPHNDVEVRDTEEVNMEPEVSDKAYEINAFNSNRFSPRDYVRCHRDDDKPQENPETQCLGLNMVKEQSKDDILTEVRTCVISEKATKAVQRKHMVIDNILYYITDPDNEVKLRLYIPVHLREKVVVQYHDGNGHMGIDKTYEAIKLNYYWPNLYKELYSYISTCVTCKARNLKKINTPLQETDDVPYPFAKIGLDLSGPYPRTLSGNRYVISFVDLYSAWPEAFAVPDKGADNIAHLLIEEIFPRFGCPLQIVTDNGTENVNKVIKEVLTELNISHVTTSFYRPQGNSKVERFHRTLKDVLAKKIEDDLTSWDLYLNQTLAAVRFNVSESAKFSPFFLLYNRDVVLPIDNLLKPHRKYMGEEPHKIALQQQHKAFNLVHKHLLKAKKRQAKYANRNTQVVDFQVGDPVYLLRHQRNSKLQSRWLPYYRIIEQKAPMSYVIKNQLDGKTVKSHAAHMRLANMEWEIPRNTTGRPLRKVAYMVPPEEELSSSESESDSGVKNSTQSKLAKRFRRKRENSSSEEDIPLFELATRLRARKEAHMSDSDTESYSDHIDWPRESDSDMEVG
jgi:hypothetical protein